MQRGRNRERGLAVTGLSSKLTWFYVGVRWEWKGMKSRGKRRWRLWSRGAAVLRGRVRESLAASNPFCRHVCVKPGCLAHNHPCWSGRRLTVLDFVKCSPQIVVDGVTRALGPGAVEWRVTLSLRWFRRSRWHLRFPGLPDRFCNTSSLVRLRNFWHPVRMPDCSFFWVNRGWTDYKIAHCWWDFLLSQLTSFYPQTLLFCSWRFGWGCSSWSRYARM